MADGNGNFPRPYKNTVTEDDPIMKRVPMDHTDIGARPSGMPRGASAPELTIEHVGGSATGSRR